MTHKEKVLKIYPDAKAYDYYSGQWHSWVIEAYGYVGNLITKKSSNTEQEAWENAYERIYSVNQK